MKKYHKIILFLFIVSLAVSCADSTVDVSGLPTSPATNGTDQYTPLQIALYQNYPNPFNPSTTIRFDLPVGMKVTMTVRTDEWEEVEILINNRFIQEGIHVVHFDAENLPSGEYYYVFEAGPATLIGKMKCVK